MPAHDLDNALYADPSLYDILHAAGTAEEVDGLERICARFCSPEAAELPWLEPACGTGRYVRVAARRGLAVHGFDLSPAMIEYARRRLDADRSWRLGAGGWANVFVGDMTSFAELPPRDGVGRESASGNWRRERCGFAFCLINTFRHLGAETGDDAPALAHLDQMRKALAPGGVYAVGVHITTYGVEDPSEDVWTGGRGRKHVTQVVQYEPADAESRLETVISHLVVRTDTGETHADAVYRLRAYDREQWEGLLERAGWEILGSVDEHGEDHRVGAFGYGIFVIRPR